MAVGEIHRVDFEAERIVQYAVSRPAPRSILYRREGDLGKIVALVDSSLIHGRAAGCVVSNPRLGAELQCNLAARCRDPAELPTANNLKSGHRSDSSRWTRLCLIAAEWSRGTHQD